MKLLFPTPLFLLLLAAPACSCDGDGVDDLADASAADAAPGEPRRINGTVIDTFIMVDGTSTAPVDMSGVTIEAIVDDGAGGTLILPGSGASDGTFTIDDVPAGEFILRTDTRYRVMSSSTIDLGRAVVGRPDAGRATTPTNLTFDVTGMTPYVPGERLDFFAPNAAASEAFLETTLVPELVEDDVTIASSIDWSTALEPNLVDSAAGDVAYLLRYSREFPGLEAYDVLRQILELPSLAMANGASTTVAGAFTNTTLDQTTTVGFNPADWDVALADLGPTDLVAPEPSIGLLISPFRIDHGDLSFIELATYNPVAGDELHAFDLAYSNPFPADWTPYETASAVSVGFVDPPDNTTIGVGFILVSDVAGGLFGDVVPRISGVRAPRVDGADLAVAQAGPATPTLSWSAPAIGAADTYIIVARELGVGSRGLGVGSIATSNTSVTIPAGLLESGKRYFFEITAASDPSTDYDAAPFRTTGPIHSSARRSTAVYTAE